MTMTRSSTTSELTHKAKKACLKLAAADTDTKNRLLFAIGENIRERSRDILEQNALDVEMAKQAVENGEVSKPLLDRLVLSEDKIKQLSVYLEEVAKLEDPVGRRQFGTKLADGLELERVTCPIGLLAVIFESRPEVVIQVTALCLKSGNGAILKGGMEAAHSNRILFSVIDDTLKGFDLSNAVNLIETREDVAGLLRCDDDIDLIIPRGSNEFVKYIQDNTRIPVLGHSSGICHLYIDCSFDASTLVPVVLDSKLDYPSACNALETLLVHRAAAVKVLPKVLPELIKNDVLCLGCSETVQIAKSAGIILEAAQESDWSTEYTDLILSIRVVDSIDDAIDHINTYGSHHTDSILTNIEENASRFLDEVDSACVFHNTSTRFSDGYVFGLGAEVGISTNKTHSRGPVGLDGLIIYKYKLRGSGQLRTSFSGPEAEKFLHQPI